MSEQPALQTLNAVLPEPYDDGLVHLLVDAGGGRPLRWRVACQQAYFNDDPRYTRFKRADEPVNCMRCMLYSPTQGTKT